MSREEAPSDNPEGARIVAAAQRLSGRQSAGFTMRELARAAGVSRATLYRRVQNRGALTEQLRTHGVSPPRAARERLISAAGELMAARGLAGFTMEDVAARASVSTATLYREFADRDALIREVLQSIGSPAPAARAARRLRCTARAHAASVRHGSARADARAAGCCSG